MHIEPWPTYDRFGNDWWSVRVIGEHGTFTLAWSRALLRFSDSSELRRIRSKSRRLAYTVGQHLQALLGSRQVAA